MPVTRSLARLDSPLILRVRSAAIEACDRGTELLAQEAKRLCPVASGDLAASIRAQPARATKRGAIGRVVADGKHAGETETHVAFVEFGHATPTRKHRKRSASTPPPIQPRPFMRPAADNARAAARLAAVAAIAAALRSA